MPKVWLTGGAGFIGKHLTSYLSNRGFEVHATTRQDCDLARSDEVRAAYSSIRPDIVVNLAAHVKPGRDWSTIESQYRDTVMSAVNLVREAPVGDIRLAVFFGSCEEYGNGAAPFVETQAPVCFSPYGWGKIATLHAVEGLATQRELPWCWVRPFLTFGPGHGANQLVPSVIRACLRGESVPLSPGEQTRDFIYINDLCEMIFRILSRPEAAAGKILNLASGEPRTIKSVAVAIRDLIDSGSLEFGALAYRKAEAMSFHASTAHFERIFGKVEQTPFELALLETIIAEKRALECEIAALQSQAAA